MANAVHKNYVEGLAGKKVDLRKKSLLPGNITINWDLVDYVQEQGIALREAALASSQLSMYFALSSWSSSQFLNLLLPLDDYLSNDPIQDFDQVSKGLLTRYSRDGKTYGVPIAPVVDILFYDKKKFADAGFSEPPKSFEDVLKAAAAASGTGSNGQPNYGMRFSGTMAELDQWAAIYGGRLMTDDYQLMIDQPPMIKALEAAAKLYSAGGIPPNFFNITADEWLNLDQQGQVAAEIRGSGYYQSLTDPNQSRIADHVGAIAIPPSSSASIDVVPVPSATWYMVIPNNAADKTNAWSLAKALMSPDATLDMSLNTMTPPRAETMKDPALRDSMPADVLAALEVGLGAAVPDLPGFDKQADAAKIFQDAAASVIQGKSEALAAMQAAKKDMTPLLPQ